MSCSRQLDDPRCQNINTYSAHIEWYNADLVRNIICQKAEWPRIGFAFLFLHFFEIYAVSIESGWGSSFQASEFEAHSVECRRKSGCW